MNSKWIKAAGVRAIKTVAQTAVATIGTAAVLGDVNWVAVASAAAAGVSFKASCGSYAANAGAPMRATVARLRITDVVF